MSQHDFEAEWEPEWEAQWAMEGAIEEAICQRFLQPGADGMEWLCEESLQRKGEPGFLEWLDEVRSVLNSHDPKRPLVERASDFRIESDKFSVLWRRRERTLTPRLFRLMEILAERENRWVGHEEIADHLGGGEDKSGEDSKFKKLYHIKSRLCSALRNAGMPDLADSIRSEVGAYGIFFRNGV